MRDALYQFVSDKLRSLDVQPGDWLQDDTSLIQSNLLDSLALLELGLWIQDQLGSPLNLEAEDIPRQWDTVSSIVRFIEEHRER